MKTIEEVREEITQIIYKSSYGKFLNLCYPIADKILSIVIGEEERECPDIHLHKKPSVYWEQGMNCFVCKGTGIIKHPITIRDAIERVK